MYCGCVFWCYLELVLFCFFKQKTAYEMRISDWSSDVSSDLHQFLVAMPRLDDENFTHTVSLLCEHSDDGAIGLVINRPTDLKLSEMMEQMELEHQGLADEAIVFWGDRKSTRLNSSH